MRVKTEQSYKNTEGTSKRPRDNDDFDDKLRGQIKEESYKYDFKYIKKEFKSTSQ